MHFGNDVGYAVRRDVAKRRNWEFGFGESIELGHVCIHVNL